MTTSYEEAETFFLGNSGLGVKCQMSEYRQLLLKLIATKEWRRYRASEVSVQMISTTLDSTVASVAVEYANAEAEMIQAAARIIQEFENQ